MNSCTGHGEFFIRNVVAFRVSGVCCIALSELCDSRLLTRLFPATTALMEYGGLSLKAASDKVVHEILVKDGGEGGLIAIDRHGNVNMPFNSEGMYRGEMNAAGQHTIAIFGDSDK